MNILLIGLSIIVLVSLTVKVLNIIYIHKMSREYERRKMELEKINLINSTVPYEQFKKVAKESSVLNSPVRTKGDFMDFIIDSICLNDYGIESKILTLNYGDENE